MIRHPYRAAPAPQDIDQRTDRITLNLPTLDVPAPHVVPVTDADLPPIPAPQNRVINPFHYQSLRLDLDTGALTFHCEDWRQEERPERGDLRYWGSGSPLHRSYGTRVETGRTLMWVVSTGTKFVPYLTAAEGTALAERALPYARTLASGLLRIESTTGFDFTAAAAVAGDEIDWLCGVESLYDALPPERRGAPLTGTFAESGQEEPRPVFDAADLLTQEVLSQFFGQRDITQATEETLVKDSEWFAHALGRQVPGGADPEYGGLSRVLVVGALSVLFALRSKLAQGRTPVPAQEWFVTTPAAVERLTATATDADVEDAAREAQAEATLAGVQITGSTEYLTQHRKELREELRWELEKVGRATKAAEEELKKQRSARAGLILSILSWGEGDTDADLGRLASTSRQAVQQLRERATADSETDGGDQ